MDLQASMKRVLITLAILIWPMTAYGAILPQPTGSCPTVCRHYEMDVSADMSKLPTCLPENKVSYTCVQGKCVKPGETPQEDDLPCNYTLDDILQSAVNFVNFILGLAGAFALLMLASGGYSFITSMGNPEAINKAKGTIIGGFIGLILITGAVIFVQFGAVLIGGKVKPTGEVSFESIQPKVEDCSSKIDGKACGGAQEHRVCYKKSCVNECDYKATKEKDLYGFSCQALSGQLKGDGITYITVPDGNQKNPDGTQELKSIPQQYCKPNLCPGDNSGFQCCITVERQAELKRLQESQNKNSQGASTKTSQ